MKKYFLFLLIVLFSVNVLPQKKLPVLYGLKWGLSEKDFMKLNESKNLGAKPYNLEIDGITNYGSEYLGNLHEDVWFLTGEIETFPSIVFFHFEKDKLTKIVHLLDKQLGTYLIDFNDAETFLEMDYGMGSSLNLWNTEEQDDYIPALEEGNMKLAVTRTFNDGMIIHDLDYSYLHERWNHKISLIAGKSKAILKNYKDDYLY